ncbi:MAG: D-alanyl-D-alanine carboxypeptidase [Clostridia bacterium]|nr:D-alanyl-D-alanine carboxypeptidase [Clostridia bacterium]
MKKNLFISLLLALCIFAAPMGAVAEGNSAPSEQAAAAVQEAAPALTADNPDVKTEYVPQNQAAAANAPEIGCKAAYVADPATGKVLYEKNAQEKMYPASTTKILTALVVLENCKLEETAVVSQQALDLVPEGYSNAGLQAGEEISVEILLQALLIPSANEAANVLAEHVSGSIEAFAQLCNKRAEELGCKVLHFVNANGMHDENHYCSAYDMYLVAKECEKHDAFKNIVQMPKFTVPPTSIHPQDDRTYENTNELILSGSSYYYTACNGIKTGHTTEAGECLVASASKDNLNLISVVLGGSITDAGENERFSDTVKLFDFAYDNYAIASFAKQYDVYSTIEVKKATKDTASLDVVIDADITSIAPKGLKASEIKTGVDLNEDIEAPIKRNQVLGTVTLDIDGMRYTANLIARTDVEKQPYWLYNILVCAAILLIVLVIILIVRSNKKRKRAQLAAARKRRERME